MSVTKTLFDTMPDGTEVYLLTIENNNGVSAGIITRGATLQSFVCPDKEGKMGDIIMGFDNVAGHIASGTYTGNIIGQYANRLCGGRFTVGGKEYQVTQNEKGKTCLHGGGEFNSAVWKAIIIDDDAVEFSYKSPDGKEGFPGNLDVTVTYILTDHNELEIRYKAVPDCVQLSCAGYVYGICDVGLLSDDISCEEPASSVSSPDLMPSATAEMGRT